MAKRYQQGGAGGNARIGDAEADFLGAKNNRGDATVKRPAGGLQACSRRAAAEAGREGFMDDALPPQPSSRQRGTQPNSGR